MNDGTASLQIITTLPKSVFLTSSVGNGTTYATIDLATGTLTSFVPISAFHTILPDGAYLFVDDDVALIKGPNMDTIEKIPGSELQAGQTYFARAHVPISRVNFVGENRVSLPIYDLQQAADASNNEGEYPPAPVGTQSFEIPR